MSRRYAHLDELMSLSFFLELVSLSVINNQNQRHSCHILIIMYQFVVRFLYISIYQAFRFGASPLSNLFGDFELTFSGEKSSWEQARNSKGIKGIDLLL